MLSVNVLDIETGDAVRMLEKNPTLYMYCCSYYIMCLYPYVIVIFVI